LSPAAPSARRPATRGASPRRGRAAARRARRREPARRRGERRRRGRGGRRRGATRGVSARAALMPSRKRYWRTDAAREARRAQRSTERPAGEASRAAGGVTSRSRRGRGPRGPRGRRGRGGRGARTRRPWPISASCEPRLAHAPASSSTITSAARTVDSRWAMSSTVRPAPGRVRGGRDGALAVGSRWLVGSSQTRRVGPGTSARAMAEPLPLAAREPRAALAEHGVEAVRQALGELGRRRHEGLVQAGVVGVGRGEAQVSRARTSRRDAGPAARRRSGAATPRLRGTRGPARRRGCGPRSDDGAARSRSTTVLLPAPLCRRGRWSSVLEDEVESFEHRRQPIGVAERDALERDAVGPGPGAFPPSGSGATAEPARNASTTGTAERLAASAARALGGRGIAGQPVEREDVEGQRHVGVAADRQQP